MKEYFEYEDGTFWAIRTEGSNCFTVHGSKYSGLNPETMLDIKTEEKNYWQLPNLQHTTFADSSAAEVEGQKWRRKKTPAL
jgi:hypothetical protein